MISGSLTRIPAVCPHSACSAKKLQPGKEKKSLLSDRIVRKGFYYRTSDSRFIARFRCHRCKKTFSHATGSELFGQKKRRLNASLEKLLTSGVTLRSAAKILRTTRTTVVRKSLFLEKRAVSGQAHYLDHLTQNQLITHVQFDEMESFERSKCLPLSILLMVETQTRRILGFKVCVMPAKGLLAEISRKKYGLREDRRTQAANELFSELKPYLSPRLDISSDQNPRYPNWIRAHYPGSTHKAYKGRRGCVVGQGELKRGGHDPLFSLNHTAAMIRAHLSRLFRRTWNTTKKRERLSTHLSLYMRSHNLNLEAHLA